MYHGSPASLERQRGTWGDHVQAALGVERVGEAEQVVLVGSTAVVEQEQALRLARRRPLTVSQHGVDPTHQRFWLTRL